MRNSIVRLVQLSLLTLISILILSACSVGKKISYFQDTTSEGVEIPEPQLIRIKPGDKISVDVYSRDDQIEEMMNIPVLRKWISQRNDDQSLYDVEFTQTLGVSLYSVNKDGDVFLPVAIS